MPHGVLFRGGDERKIRTRLLDDDIIDAVIGLAPNLFYGTGIPACVLVLRAPGTKPAERHGKVLFINADAEFAAGRAQNYLLPEHAEKIVSSYREFGNIPGYATVVTREELRANDDNLNIRRYADNAPPPEPQDVRAHLHGGVPRAEFGAKAPLFTAHGFSPERVFVARDDAYLDFDPGVTKADLKGLITTDEGIQGREAGPPCNFPSPCSTMSSSTNSLTSASPAIPPPSGPPSNAPSPTMTSAAPVSPPPAPPSGSAEGFLVRAWPQVDRLACWPSP
jgi:type I restriction enzyme M protein